MMFDKPTAAADIVQRSRQAYVKCATADLNEY